MSGSNVHNSFERWVTAKLPQAVASALRRLHEEGGEDDADDKGPDADGEDERKETHKLLKQLVLYSGGQHGTREDILKAAQDRFAKATASLNKHRTVTMTEGNSQSNMRLDIAFVMDCTGSMRDRLPTLLKQFKVMLADPKDSLIAKAAGELQVDLEVRFALLGYRDRSDGNSQFVDCKSNGGSNFFDCILRDEKGDPKRDESDALVPDASVVNAQFDSPRLAGTGGDDSCEDVPAALDRALSWPDWQLTNFNFLLLFTDAPCHGSDFNAGLQDNSPGDSEASRRHLKDAFEKAVAKNVFVMHCALEPATTKLMFAEMKKQAEAAERTQPAAKAALARKNPKASQEAVEKLIKEESDKRCLEIALPSSGPAVVTDRPHIIFCNDESGSMGASMSCGGTRWSNLVAAFNKVWHEMAHGQSVGELCSVMHHDGQSRSIPINGSLDPQPFRGAPPHLPANYGGNSFSRAASHVVGMIRDRQPAGCNPIIIFMSDGGCNDSVQARTTFETLRSSFPKMQIHSVAFGDGAQHGPLKTIADPGRFHEALSGSALATAFTSIVDGASNSKVASTVYEKVAEQLASNINQKLRDDCL